jgi:hypothetical protein
MATVVISVIGLGYVCVVVSLYHSRRLERWIQAAIDNAKPRATTRSRHYK